MNKKLSKVIFFLLVNLYVSAFAQIQNSQSLSGTWQFRLYP